MTLSNHHRTTIRKILDHPTSGNVEWRQALSLMESIGEVVEEHNGSFKVTLGPETETFHRPHDKDLDAQMIVDLRRMLVQAGYGDSEATEDSRDRDFGDDRRGKPE